MTQLEECLAAARQNRPSRSAWRWEVAPSATEDARLILSTSRELRGCMVRHVAQWLFAATGRPVVDAVVAHGRTEIELRVNPKWFLRVPWYIREEGLSQADWARIGEEL